MADAGGIALLSAYSDDDDVEDEEQEELEKNAEDQPGRVSVGGDAARPSSDGGARESKVDGENDATRGRQVRKPSETHCRWEFLFI